MIKDETIFHSVPMKVNITEERIRDLVTTAFEGGINYWVENARHELAPGMDYADFQHEENSKTGERGKYAPADYRPTTQNIPFVEGCAILFTVNEPFDDDDEEDDRREYRLDLAALKRGLELMATQAPKHFQDMLDENDDACTADVFIQLAVFEDVIYG